MRIRIPKQGHLQVVRHKQDINNRSHRRSEARSTADLEGCFRVTRTVLLNRSLRASFPLEEWISTLTVLRRPVLELRTEAEQEAISI